MANELFDELARDYGANRPRYPRILFEILANRLARIHPGDEPPRILDLGAGTGISLRGLREVIGPDPLYTAVELSADMAAQGRELTPEAHWHVGAAEPYVEVVRGVSLITIAQAFHWMDAPRLLAAAQRALVPGGLLAVLYNTRRFVDDAFLAEFEALLEENIPDYVRGHAEFDVMHVLRDNLPRGTRLESHLSQWDDILSVEGFLGLSRSTTYVARMAPELRPGFDARLRELAISAADAHGNVRVPYASELMLATLPHTG